jgi:hypothetical protein
MVGYARALAASGIDVVTFDFAYMAQQRRAPDRAPVLEQTFKDAMSAAAASRPGHRVYIGGKSMGGRIATHLAADDTVAVEGVIALGYPLHPPGRPERLRVQHFARMRAPWLIIQGERDTFGTPAELRTHLTTVPTPVTLHVVEGGDHSLAVRGRAAEAVRDEVVRTILTFTDR